MLRSLKLQPVTHSFGNHMDNIERKKLDKRFDRRMDAYAKAVADCTTHEWATTRSYVKFDSMTCTKCCARKFVFRDVGMQEVTMAAASNR